MAEHREGELNRQQGKGKIDPWLLMMDLDGTVWDHLDISSVAPPYHTAGPGRIENSDGIAVTVYPEAIDFIRWCRERGAITCTLSWNHRHYVMEALEKLGIMDLFDYHETEFSPAKDQRILHLLDILRKKGTPVEPERIVYVDDRDIHMDDIRRNVGNVIFLHIWKEVRNYDEAKKIVMRRIIGPSS